MSTTLIKNGQITDDAYTAVADGEPLPDGAAIVSLKRFLSERDTLLARNHKLGVRLLCHEPPDALGPDLERIALVVLEFPAFRDGRPFSWARALRTRLQFAGEIRATGDFLADQIAFLVRTGFDAFEVAEKITPELFQHALTEMTNVYQPSADGKKTIGELRTIR